MKSINELFWEEDVVLPDNQDLIIADCGRYEMKGVCECPVVLVSYGCNNNDPFPMWTSSC